MVTRSTEFPVAKNASYLGDITGWEAWTRLTATTWTIRSSKSAALGDIPLTGMLGFRMMYTTKLRSSQTEVYSDVIYGWDHYAIEPLRGGLGFLMWRSNDRVELVAAVGDSNAVIYDGGELDQPAWDQVHEQLHDTKRAVDF